MKKSYYVFVIFLAVLTIAKSQAQFSVSYTKQVNTDCNGNPCFYNGPKIMINEVMLSPSSGDGSMYDLDHTRRGEWIELYNPDICMPVDISCFFLGNNTPNNFNPEGVTHCSGGFVIPPGTIVPPRGFVMIRGEYAPAVPPALLVQNGGRTLEIIVNESILGNICLGGGDRLWFPNAGGWFAFYDNNGIPQDAISWCSLSNSCMSCTPCNPMLASCGFVFGLPSYNDIPLSKKNYITSLNPQNNQGQSFRRIPDGGSWVSTPSSPTYGFCNSVCVPPPFISCNGTATVFPSGGMPPYTFLWNDAQATTTATATGLCAGSYQVIVTDANHISVTVNIQIENLMLDPVLTINQPVCNGGNNGSVTVNLTKGAQPYRYLWSTGDTTNSISNLIAGNYHILIKDTNDCYADTVAIVPENPEVPLINLNDTTICSGYSVTLNAATNISGGIYKWSPDNQTTQAITVTPPNTAVYSVMYSVAGCVAKDTVTVSVKPSPHALIHMQSHLIMEGDSVLITASGGLSFFWNNGLLSDIILMKPKADTVYCVYVSNNNGCYDTACVDIVVKGYSTLYVPNAFTPNGNGLNDVFHVYSTNIEKFNMLIYNRWGNLLFETNDVNKAWDGRFNDELVPEGIYVYSIQAMGYDKVFHRKLGSVTVLR